MSIVNSRRTGDRHDWEEIVEWTYINFMNVNIRVEIIYIVPIHLYHTYVIPLTIPFHASIIKCKCKMYVVLVVSAGSECPRVLQRSLTLTSHQSPLWPSSIRQTTNPCLALHLNTFQLVSTYNSSGRSFLHLLSQDAVLDTEGELRDR